jgi:hypothetical protein
MTVCGEANMEPLCWYTPEFSALFRPFIVSKTLNAGEQIVFAYFAAVGIVLASPFTAELWRLGRERLPAIGRRWLNTELGRA